MEEGTRARDIAPTGIRLPIDLRELLQRESQINGRTLSGEIVARLRASLEVAHVATVLHTGPGPAPAYAGQPGPSAPLSDAQRMLRSLFDGLGPDKQLALLTVLRR